MSVAAIEERIKEIGAAIEQSAANHNALVGRLQEAQHLLSMVAEGVPALAPVVDALDIAEEVIAEVSPIVEEIEKLVSKKK